MTDIWEQLRKDVIGGERGIYADWTASGRLLYSVEEHIISEVAPTYANTHTESSIFGKTTTKHYLMARDNIRKHCNATDTDHVLVLAGSGMTDLMGRLSSVIKNQQQYDKEPFDLIVCSRHEHHSNDLIWRECGIKTQFISNNSQGLPCLDSWSNILAENKGKRILLAMAAVSNVTGRSLNHASFFEIGKSNGNVTTFVDYSTFAPYGEMKLTDTIDRQPLTDVLAFSFHKFIGGPQGPGAMFINKELLSDDKPIIAGGGTVDWVSPDSAVYLKNLEEREDSGTPAIIQTIRGSLAINIKEKMVMNGMAEREKHIIKYFSEGLSQLSSYRDLVAGHTKKLPIFPIISEQLSPKDLCIQLSNNGIQTRDGCNCAGVLGHDLFGLDSEAAVSAFEQYQNGLAGKPGWVRVSLHPTTTDSEMDTILNVLDQLAPKVS